MFGVGVGVGGVGERGQENDGKEKSKIKTMI